MSKLRRMKRGLIGYRIVTAHKLQAMVRMAGSLYAVKSDFQGTFDKTWPQQQVKEVFGPASQGPQ